MEAASYARLTLARVSSFIWSHIICRHGVPHELISDRGHISEQRSTLCYRYMMFSTMGRLSTCHRLIEQ